MIEKRPNNVNKSILLFQITQTNYYQKTIIKTIINDNQPYRRTPMTYPNLISQTNIQAVTATELRDYLRGDDGESDDVLTMYIKTATEYLETAARCSITRKRYMIDVDNYTKSSIRLPMGHVEALVIVEADGLIRNITDYILRGDVVILPMQHSHLKITYDTGFGSTASVPLQYKMAILACASDLFIHRFSGTDANYSMTHQMFDYYSNMFKNYSL
jgi:uncharacterized phiE125 gp8 family phage protein